MSKLALLGLCLLLPGMAGAQTQDNWSQDDTVQDDSARDAVALGTGAMLRGVDKVSGYVTDIELANGGVGAFERLTVELGECRHPSDDAALDAYAFLTIRDTQSGEEFFSGWMLASSPALNAMEHPRYDIWVLRCKTE